MVVYEMGSEVGVVEIVSSAIFSETGNPLVDFYRDEEEAKNATFPWILQ